MKLNKKGMEIFDKWMNIWEKEIERLEAEEPNADTGWGCLENDSFEKTIDDCIGIAILGDDDDAIYHILENFSANEEYAFGYTAAEVVEMMKPYFDINEDEDDLTWELDKTTFYIDCGDGTYTHGEWVDREAAESFCKSARACGDNLTVIGTEPPVGYERVGGMMNTSALSKAYLQAQAHADTTALQIMHHLNCIEAFRNRDEDTWDSVGTLNSINAKLDEVLAEIVAYHDLRVAEEDR